MLFVNKFCSRLKYYNITHHILNLVFKSVSRFKRTQQTFACLKSTTKTKFEICSQITIKILERHHWHRSNVFILNLVQLLQLFLVLHLITLNTGNSLWAGGWGGGGVISQAKPLKIIFLINFAIAKICVEIHLQ